MTKKNKLYTVNRWNQPAFMPKENLFFDGGQSSYSLPPLESYLPQGLSNDTYRKLAIGSAGQMQNAFHNYGQSVVSNFGKGPLTQNNSPFKNTSMLNTDSNTFFNAVNTAGTLGSAAREKGTSLFSKDAWQSGGAGWAATGAAAGALGSIKTGERRGMWDTLDPVHHLAGGRESAAGNAMGDAGVALTQAGLSSGQPWMALAGAGLKIVGGLTNAAFGIKEDKEKVEAANNSIKQNENYVFNGSLDYMPDIAAATDTNAYKGGWFSGGKARRKNRELTERMANARDWAFRSQNNGIDNILNDQMNDALYNYSAFGGPIDTMNDNMGAIGYGFMSDYLDTKKKNSDNKNQMTNLFMGTPKTFFDFGGDLQTHGADWSDGLITIGTGGTHEENKYDGVQLGVDENNVPNLVEENETIFNDYVYSARILADAQTKEKFRLPKKKDITFAEISKKLEKEIAERPNDVISEAGFKAQMSQLAEEQERQKAEMEAQRAKEAFEALSPEEQTALMQQRAQQEQMAEQAAQQQATSEELAMTQQAQMSPEEQAAMEQQQLAQMQANVSALGGQLVKAGDVEGNENLYAFAGRMKKRAAKKYGADWFKQMGNALGMTEDEMKGFLENLNPNDPDANMAAFNAIYRTNQENAARKRYIDSQRQSRKNELFGDKGLYRTSDDGKNFYKAMTNSKLRNGWINANYRGQEEYEDDIKDGRFISDEAYQKLSKEEQEKYRRINEKAGDKMYDFNGRLLEIALPDGTTVDSILDTENSDYAKGFKWDPKEAQTLQYPVGMDHSNMSYLRYVPALGGAVGLMNDIFSSPDYSNAEKIEKAGSVVPMTVTPNYNPTYMTYKPFDRLFYANQLNGQSLATQRMLANTNSPSKGANLLAHAYNTMLANGQLYRQGEEYNDTLKKQVATHNSGENKTLAQLDMQAQIANQKAYDDANRLGFYGTLYGAQMRNDIDAKRNASMNANLTNLMQSIGNIGEEAYDEDRLKWLEGTGVLRSDYFNRGKYGASAAKGGKIKKKRGLTI